MHELILGKELEKINYIQMKTLENMRDTLLLKFMSGEVMVKI